MAVRNRPRHAVEGGRPFFLRARDGLIEAQVDFKGLIHRAMGDHCHRGAEGNVLSANLQIRRLVAQSNRLHESQGLGMVILLQTAVRGQLPQGPAQPQDLRSQCSHQ